MISLSQIPMTAHLPPLHLQFRKKGMKERGKKRRKEIGRKEGRKKDEREGKTCFFKSTNQKFHILLLLTNHWPELRHMATPGYNEN